MTCLCPLFWRIRLWTFELVHGQSPWLAWVAPIAHARLNRASLTWCTQLDTIFRWRCFDLVVWVVRTIRHELLIYSCVSVPNCPCSITNMVLHFLFEGQYSLTVSFETISTQCSWSDFLIYPHAVQYRSTIWLAFWESAQETSLGSQNLSFAISVTWT